MAICCVAFVIQLGPLCMASVSRFAVSQEFSVLDTVACCKFPQLMLISLFLLVFQVALSAFYDEAHSEDSYASASEPPSDENVGDSESHQAPAASSSSSARYVQTNFPHWLARDFALV